MPDYNDIMAALDALVLRHLAKTPRCDLEAMMREDPELAAAAVSAAPLIKWTAKSASPWLLAKLLLDRRIMALRKRGLVTFAEGWVLVPMAKSEWADRISLWKLKPKTREAYDRFIAEAIGDDDNPDAAEGGES